MCHGWMFGAWNVASLELCRRAYVNGQYAWPASQGIEVSNLWKVSKILVLIGILLCFLYEKQTVSFDVNSLPLAISTSTPPGPHDLPSGDIPRMRQQ